MGSLPWSKYSRSQLQVAFNTTIAIHGVYMILKYTHGAVMINTFKEFELLPLSHGLWDRFATVCGIAPSQTVADFFMYNFTIKNYESRKKRYGDSFEFM